jgi:dTDP-4-amino-4,6-dideoxygalactose transaminase
MVSLRTRSAENRPQLRDELMRRLATDGIDTRPFFYPMHVMPPPRDERPFPVADRISTSGLNLPSSPRLTQDDVAHVSERLCVHLFDLLTGDLVGREAPTLQPGATR